MKEKIYGDINANPVPLSNRAITKTLETGNNKIEDEDVHSSTRNNAEFIEQNNIKIFQESMEIEEDKFYINIFTQSGPNTQKYLVIHDSEDAAFDTGLRAIKNGGALIALENRDSRNLYSFGANKGDTGQDPNRIFDRDSRYWPLAQKVLDLLGESTGDMIISLHNNKQDRNFNLNNLEKQENISILSKEDPDPQSMILIPGSAPEPNQKTHSEIKYYRDQGLNVIYEHVPEDEPVDGSLSNYATRKGLPYRNLEAPAPVRGDQKSEARSLEKQTQYLEVIRKYYSL